MFILKKLLDKTIPLTANVKEFSFPVAVDEAGNYQLVFYVGTMDGTCWIDKVMVDIE